MALLIVWMLLWIIFRESSPNPGHRKDRVTYRIWGVTFVFSMLQILMGTQVRQFVDERVKEVGTQAPELWLQDPSILFYVHRSFSIVVLLLHIWVAYRVIRNQLGYHKIKPTLATLMLIILSGVAMNYLDFPWGSQPVHLFMAAVLFGLQAYLLLELYRVHSTAKTS